MKAQRKAALSGLRLILSGVLVACAVSWAVFVVGTISSESSFRQDNSDLAAAARERLDTNTDETGGPLTAEDRRKFEMIEASSNARWWRSTRREGARWLVAFAPLIVVTLGIVLMSRRRQRGLPAVGRGDSSERPTT